MAGQPTIPKEMRAAQVVEFNKPYQINSVPVPSNLGPYDLLLKVAVASHCHTDIMVQNKLFAQSTPITGSHEGAGTVVAVGSSLTNDNFKIGDRVMAGLPFHPCGKCTDCLGPAETLRQYCPNLEGIVGVMSDGAFADYVRVDGRHATVLPPQISLLVAAPFACAGRTVWRAVQEAALRPGQTLAILGSGGGLGHIGVQFAKKVWGLRVIGVEARDEGIALTKANGADEVLDARDGKDAVVEQVHRLTVGGLGVDATVVLSDSDDSMALACAITKMHGTVVEVAQPDNIIVPFREVIFRDVRIKGSLICSPEESKAMVRAIAEHGIAAKVNIFKGLDKIADLLELVEGGHIQGKAVIIVDQAQLDKEQEALRAQH